MRFVDLFSGIGGIRLGLEQAGHTCVGWCEFDKYAQKSYRAMYSPDEKGEWFSSDIRTVSSADIGRLHPDILCFGFPCTDISVAGKQAGFFKENEEGEERELTRSGLFFEVMRILAGMQEELKPRFLLIENVKNLFSIGKGFGFLRCILEMDAVGYDVEWQLLNSKDFGVPQNRERVFIVGHLRGGSGRKVFPLQRADKKDSAELQGVSNSIKQIGHIDGYKADNPQAYRVYDTDGLSPTLSSSADTNKPYIIDNSLNINIQQIQCYKVPQTVSVRKYDVDVPALQSLLRSAKDNTKLTIKDIAGMMSVGEDKVAHWFRTDECFAIPTPDVWMKLKEVLKINTVDFDSSIMEFVEMDSKFDQANRVYGVDGIAPTITSTNADISVLGKVNQIGRNVDTKLGSQRYRVYDTDGLSPTLCAGMGEGGNTQPFVIDNKNDDEKIKKLGSYSRGGYNAQAVVDPSGIAPTVRENHGQVTGVVVRPVLTPARMEKKQNCRRMKDDGEEMFTLTTQDIHGVAIEERMPKVIGGIGEPNDFGKQFRQGNRIYSTEAISPALQANSGNASGGSVLIAETDTDNNASEI